MTAMPQAPLPRRKPVRVSLRSLAHLAAQAEQRDAMRALERSGNPTGPWTFTLGMLPPGVNHMYAHLPGGKLALTAEALNFRDTAQIAANRAGFRRDRHALYTVEITFFVPTWSHDVDGPLKAALDALFGSRGDNRVVSLLPVKVVTPDLRDTLVTIRVMPEDAYRELVAFSCNALRTQQQKERQATQP